MEFILNLYRELRRNVAVLFEHGCGPMLLEVLSVAERGYRATFINPITAVGRVSPAGHKPPHRLVCFNLTPIRSKFCETTEPFVQLCLKRALKPFSTFYIAALPLLTSMAHGSRTSSEYLRRRLKLIPAVPPPAKGGQQAHHQAFYKQ